ncbi:MAG: hypothetical protein KGQ41_08445 [Alphaproteobacteria bacterium]|nr:hypothetical protein [Alphaproteobacteria bacterium]
MLGKTYHGTESSCGYIVNDIQTIIARMQDAVDVVLTSEHQTSRVAACIFNPVQPEAAPFVAVNSRPACLKGHLEWDARLGASSQFIHAELAAIAGFGGDLRGSHLCVTDPFCPNCAKNIAESGVRTVYIDHKGFQKDFIARNGDEFQSMSMLVAERAGISVYVVNRKEQTVTPIREFVAQTRPSPSAIEFFDIRDGMTLEKVIPDFKTRIGTRESWALAFIREADGSPRGLLVFEALPPGFTPADFKTRGDSDTGKYRFPIDPLTRLLITVKRMGFTIPDGRVACGRVPSSRALVNALGFGCKSLIVASRACDHDPTGADALAFLTGKELLKLEEI